MVADPGQREDISAEFKEMTTELLEAKEHWEAEVLSELPEVDPRTFPVGHPDYTYTQIPARDGLATGNIQR
jgi:ABC-type Zn uptake system ZnuABC Zn-binding protein ZnuA